MTNELASIEIYQLRVYLREISSMIWRRFLVRSDNTIADLHHTLQIAMGWEDAHLHEFIIRGKRYGISWLGGIVFSDNAHQVQLSDLRLRVNERFLYEYDFYDQWQHEIRLEKQLPFDPAKSYPVCTGGARAAPPEDCGGPWAYLELKQKYNEWHIAQRILEIYEEGSSGEYREELKTFLYWLKADKFDRRSVNRQLKQYIDDNEDSG
ncbi:MAG: plasmid pRiA4b ORF-3 family protein [Caldilineaceae bacterium]|nr:plasmid pRiA4b ORF-3 family protein [Caldilineaceae bacterium]